MAARGWGASVLAHGAHEEQRPGEAEQAGRQGRVRSNGAAEGSPPLLSRGHRVPAVDEVRPEGEVARRVLIDPDE